MNRKRALRYLAPNLITSFNILLGLMSFAAMYRQDFEMAAWLIVYAALFDRLDGFVARLVRGSSEFGVQMDSFADFLNFGVAPAALVYTSVGSSPFLPFHEPGFDRYLLITSCVLWTFAAAFRLARYNVTEDAPSPLRMRIFFGIPTTVVGGLFATWYLALYKYAPEGAAFPMLPEAFGGMKLFGESFETPTWIWNYTPVLMLAGAYGMASSLRLPKSWLMRRKISKILYYGPIFLGIGLGLIQLFPEYMIWPPTFWIAIFMVWGAMSPAARSVSPPPVFPATDPPPGKEPIRPEDEIQPEGVEAELDPPEPVAAE